MNNHPSDENPNALAEHALAQNEYLKAMVLYSQAIEQQSENPKHYLGRARALNFLLDPESAIADLDRAVELGLDNSEVFLLRGKCRFLDQCRRDDADYAAALADFRRIPAEDKNHAAALIGVALVLARQGDYTAAIKELEQAVEENQDCLKDYVEITDLGLRFLPPDYLPEFLLSEMECLRKSPLEADCYSNRARNIYFLEKSNSPERDWGFLDASIAIVLKPDETGHWSSRFSYCVELNSIGNENDMVIQMIRRTVESDFKVIVRRYSEPNDEFLSETDLLLWYDRYHDFLMQNGETERAEAVKQKIIALCDKQIESEPSESLYYGMRGSRYYAISFQD